MVMKNCLLIREMLPDEAAHALKKMSDIIAGDVSIGIWKGEINSEMSKNSFKGNHVSAFDEQSLLAPFGPQGDQRSEACAMLFAIAQNNATSLSNALNQNFSVDATLVEADEQIKSIGKALNQSSTPEDSVSQHILMSIAHDWKESIKNGEDVNDLLTKINLILTKIKDFRMNVIENINNAPKINMTSNLVARAISLELNEGDLDSLVNDVYKNSATNGALDKIDEVTQDEMFPAKIQSAQDINSEGLAAQVECLVKAYGISGATYLVSESHKLKKMKP